MTEFVEFSQSRLLPMPVEVPWAVTDLPTRNAEWCSNVRSVSGSSGPARVGDTFEEVSVVVGPWTSRTTWTVVSIEHHRERTFTGRGFPGVGELQPFLRFRALTGSDGSEHTYVTYGSRLELRMGRFNRLAERVLRRMLAAEFTSSLANLEQVCRRDVRAAARA